MGRWWILTIRHADFTPWLPPSVSYIKGQLEIGHQQRVGDGGGVQAGEQELRDDGEAGRYLHWQIVAYFASNVRLAGVRKLFGPHHAELTKSANACDYVWKDDTSVAGTRFELGHFPFKRNDKRDWGAIRGHAKAGNFDAIDDATFVVHYSSLKRIACDYMVPTAVERTVNVFWGGTGLGKSRRAWDEASMQAYPKDPRSKFWCGYRGQEHVVIDEFRGGIDIGHLLRWLDRYPVIVEIKGGAVCLQATHIWITSNLDPKLWYPDLDEKTTEALLRRLNVTEFFKPFVCGNPNL